MDRTVPQAVPAAAASPVKTRAVTGPKRSARAAAVAFDRFYRTFSPSSAFTKARRAAAKARSMTGVYIHEVTERRHSERLLLFVLQYALSEDCNAEITHYVLNRKAQILMTCGRAQ